MNNHEEPHELDVSDVPGQADDGDRLMTVFVIGIMALLLGFAILLLIADRRPPAGL